MCAGRASCHLDAVASSASDSVVYNSLPNGPVWLSRRWCWLLVPSRCWHSLQILPSLCDASTFSFRVQFSVADSASCLPIANLLCNKFACKVIFLLNHYTYSASTNSTRRVQNVEFWILLQEEHSALNLCCWLNGRKSIQLGKPPAGVHKDALFGFDLTWPRLTLGKVGRLSKNWRHSTSSIFW